MHSRVARSNIYLLNMLGADVMNMNVSNSAIKKGETLIDTAMTLNAMHPDVLIIRHQDLSLIHI